MFIKQLLRLKECGINIFLDDPFSYFFFDDNYNAQYKADGQFGKVLDYLHFLQSSLHALAYLVYLPLMYYNAQKKSE